MNDTKRENKERICNLVMLMGRFSGSSPLNFIGTSPWISTGFGSGPNTFIFFTQALLTCKFFFFFWAQDIEYVFSVAVRIFTTSLITRVLGVGQKDGHFHNTGVHLLLKLKIYQLVYSAGFSCRMNIFFYSNMLPQVLPFLLFEFDVMSRIQKKN